MAVIATFYDHVLDIARQENISTAEALSETRAVGVRLLETSFSNVKDRVAQVGRELSAAGLGISAMPAFFDFGSDLDFDSQAAPVVAAAKELGVPKLLVIPGFWQGEEAGHEAQTRHMVDGVNRLGELAAKAGLDMTMEDFDGITAPFSTSGGMLRFMDSCPGLSACFDTGNFRFMAEDELSAYEALRGRIGHVHLKDRGLTAEYGRDVLHAVDGVDLYPSPVGAGIIQIARVLELLRADGYDGVYTVEHYGADPMLRCLQKSVEWVRARV